MELAPITSVVFGSIAFIVFWVTATFPKFTGLPIGRTAGAVVGATLVVVSQVASPDEAYASINLPILGLLFGTMLVSTYLERADMFKYLASALSYRCQGGKDLLCRLSFLVALSSALFTNDTCCVVFTEFILTLCNEKGLPPEPFLLALTSSANLGSSATPIGNPQNLVIAVQSQLPFGEFLIGILPAMLVGVTLNLCLLLGMYWKQLSMASSPQMELRSLDLSHEVNTGVQSQDHQHWDKDVEEGRDIVFSDQVTFETCQSSSGSPSYKNDPQNAPSDDGGIVNKHVKDCDDVMAHMNEQSGSLHESKAFVEECASSLQAVCVSMESTTEEIRPSVASATHCLLDDQPLPSFPAESNTRTSVKTCRRGVWKSCVYLVTIGMLAALLAGLNLSWCTITAAMTLVVVDFKDAGPSLEKVSYSLLVFFSGMFMTVDGFNRTGLPATFWNAVEPHARINHVSGTAVLTSVIILLSNVASNVPTDCVNGRSVAAGAEGSGVNSGAGRRGECEKRVAHSGVGKHSGRQLDIGGIGCKSNSVRTGHQYERSGNTTRPAAAAAAAAALLLEPLEVWCAIHLSHRRGWPPFDPRLTHPLTAGSATNQLRRDIIQKRIALHSSTPYEIMAVHGVPIGFALCRKNNV